MSWGVSNEFGRLKTVLVHEPGAELFAIDFPGPWLFDSVPNLSLAQKQHREFVRLLSRKGANVVSVPATPNAVPNLYFTRDHGVCFDEGFLPGELNAVRAPEMPLVFEALFANGVPFLEKTFAGTLEGGDVFVWDEDTLLLGQSVRTTVLPSDLAKATKKKVVGVPVPKQFIHLDLMFSLLGEQVALASIRYLPDLFKLFLRQQGVDIIAANDLRLSHSCANVVSLDNHTLIAPNSNPHTNARLQDAGFEVLAVDLSELLKGGGGPRCMTLALHRERL